MDAIIRNLSNDDYHYAPAYSAYLSSTQLKHLLVSPKNFKYHLDHPQTDTKSNALRLGSLFHLLMEVRADHYGNEGAAYQEWLTRTAVFNPPVNPTTGKPYGAASKQYQDAYGKFMQESVGKLICTPEELDLAFRMTNSLLDVQTATGRQVDKLLKWRKEIEASYFFTTSQGIKLKIRPDLLTGSKIVDWKTCSLKQLDEESIARQIANYRYDFSMAMYQWVLKQITGQWYTPILVFVQSEPPYDTIMADISEWGFKYDPELDMAIPGPGALDFQQCLETLSECVTTDNWPGAENAVPSDNTYKILKPAVPYWFGKRYYQE